MASDQITRSLQHYIQNSLDATVLCYWDQTNDQYQVDYLNPSAIALLGLANSPAYPVPVADLFPIKSVESAFYTVQHSQSPVNGQLTLLTAIQTGKTLDFEVMTLENRLVLRLTDSMQALLKAVGQHVLTTSLTNTLVYEAVRTNEGAIDNFRLIYRSEATGGNSYPEGMEVGRLLTEWNPKTKTEGLFYRYVQVVETGNSFQIEQEYQHLNQVFTVAVSRFRDGVIISTYNSTEKQRALQQLRQQATMLDAILQSSQDFIIVCQAIRNEAGHIQDFKPVLHSQAVVDRNVLTEQAASDYTFNQIRLDDPTAIEDYIKVVETGKPFRLERLFGMGKERRWFDVNATKLGDGFLIISRDIHAEKETRNQLMQQALLVEQILNSTANPIYQADAIRDEQGRIVDFRIVRSNEAGRANMIRTIGRDGTGSTVLTLYPFSQARGLFFAFVGVVEQNTVFETEQYYEYDNIRDWHHVSARKVGDGVVVTYADITGIRRAKQQIEEQAALLNSIVDSSLNGIIAFTAVRNEQGEIIDFTLVAANKAASDITGRSASNLIGQRMLTVFPGNIESGLMEQYINTVKTGEPTRARLHYPYDGINCWLDVSAQQLGDGFVVTFTDVSESERKQRLIEQSAAELRAVINSAQVAIFLITPVWEESSGGGERQIVDFCFRTANRKLASYVGQEPEALTGTLGSQWFPNYRMSGLFERYVTLFNDGEPQHFDYHYTLDGVDVWLDVSASKLENDLLITFSDYTQLKELQQRLEYSATELQTVINTSQTGIFLFTPVRNDAGEVVDFRFRLANRQLAAYVGQEPETVMGGLGSQWFPDYQTNGLFEAYHHTYATGETRRFDFHYFGSGIDVWLDIMSTKLGDEVLVTFGDYTPLKQLQQRLESSIIELQQSNANLEQFAYVASHDLQEPLRKIQSFGDLIQTQYAPIIGAEGADMIQRMQSAAARMQVLIKDVLAYSRIATKHDVLRPVNLQQLVRDVLDDLETAIVSKQAIVQVDPLPIVIGDAPQLRQLFQNLLSNALKFSRPAVPPELTITARTVQGREANMPISDGDVAQWFHLIEIADNGIGFESHHAERIFHIFQRLHRRSEYVGTGIGLAIVQKVVQNHLGYIVAEGQPGKGATFRILLPMSEG